jgi:hypothetical protein
VDVLFDKGGVFLPDAVGLATQKAIRFLRQVGVVRYYVGAGSTRREVAATVPVPQSLDQDEVAQQDARQIHGVFKSFFDVNFPMYELTNSYSCLHLDAPLSWSQREKLFKSIALHESLDAEASWPPACISVLCS